MDDNNNLHNLVDQSIAASAAMNNNAQQNLSPNKDVEQDKGDLDKFLENITIDFSIKNIEQLYAKYEEEAKNYCLVDSKKCEKDSSLLLPLKSLKIGLPTKSSESEKHYIVLCHPNYSDYETIRSFMQNVEYEKIVGNQKQQVFCNSLEFQESVPSTSGGTTNSDIIFKGTKASLKKEIGSLRGNGTPEDVLNIFKYYKETYNKTGLIDSDAHLNAVPVCEELLKFELFDNDGPIDKPIHYVFYAYDEDPDHLHKGFLSYFVGASYDNKDLANENDIINENLKNELYRISALVRNKHISNLTELVKRETVRSAKAAIMSRNMSHNLGSHVMFYIKQKLQSVGKIFQDGALAELVNIEELKDLRADDLSAKIAQIVDSLQAEKDKKDENGNLEMPFLVGLGRFLNYLQERQDYIATVATDYIPYKSVINFKDAIYDELKPELRFKRHHDNDKSKDNSIVGKAAANLLLEYIAYSEGITQSNQIELLFRKEDTNNGNNTAYFDGGGSPSDVPIKLRQLNIALPGGNLGRQAFFSIMENIIRNTAKHDAATTNIGCKKLIFKYDLIDFNNTSSLYAWTNSGFYKDSSSLTEIYLNKSNDFHYLGITIDLKNNKLDETLEKIKCGLDKGYLNDDGRINEDCKGIKEIRISAAWMRGYGIDTDIPADEPPAVAIRNNEGKLQYIICLPKPKKIAIIGNKETALDEKGVRFFLSEKIKKEGKDKDIVIRNLADFEMIVCSKNDEALIKNYVGSRILLVENVTEATDISPEVNIDNLYMRWLQSYFGSNLPKLEINDGKSYDYKGIEDISKKEDIDKLLDKDLIEQKFVLCHDGDIVSNQIVYSKHYEGQKDIRDNYQNAIFLEGVSGGNSTDRLIRQEKWTKEWYVKQMTAGLTKVAIFDERIHGSFLKPGKNLVYKDWNKEKLRDWIDKLKKENADVFKGDEIKYDFFREKIKDEFKGIINIKDFIEKASKRYVSIPEGEVLEKVILKLRGSVSSEDYSVAALYEQKGIWAFDIYTSNGIIKVKGFSEIVGKDVDVATIEKENGSVKCTINEEFKNKFDFVTVHQGILDKIYEALCIKGDDANSIKMKKQVTKELFDKFSKLPSNEITLDGFLPQFIIHSGRSRPAEKDMPQKQPFIQFAALDHAVRDCKYTLTELLYSAHYEQ